MAVIELELTTSLFLNLVSLTVKASPLIPTPTLDLLGGDRLIRDLEWRDGFTLVAAIPGYAPPPGTLLVRAPLRLWHVSVAELRVEPQTFGTAAEVTAGLAISTTPAEARVAMVAVAKDGNAPTVLPAPVRIGVLPLPLNGVADVKAAALVWRDRVVALRVGTSLSDDLLGQWPSRLLRAIDEEGTGRTWYIRVPGMVFVELLLDQLREALATPPMGTMVEEAPTASWRYSSTMKGWGVHAHVGLKQMDACPGLFGNVDISIDVTIEGVFAVRADGGVLELTMRVEGDTSDWDSFRCWLGTGAVGPLSLLRGSPAGLLPPIASLVVVSEKIRRAVGEQVAGFQIEEFEQTDRDGSWATYTRSIPIGALTSSVPFSIDPTVDVTIDGLVIQGRTGLFPPLGHAPEFVPDQGPLVGDWAITFNCSGASGPTCGHRLELPEILISDTLTALGQPVTSVPALPVTLFPTSFAEPAGKYRVRTPDRSQPSLSAKIVTSGVTRNDVGFAVIHSSAGLRAYAIGPHTNEVVQLENCDWAAGQYCDSIHVPSRVIEIQEIKWVEPPPVYHFGESPLRQWQVVLEAVPVNANVRFMALRDGVSEPLDTDGAIVRSGERIWGEFVTDGDAELAVQVEGATVQTRYRTAQRWLLPVGVAELPVEIKTLPESEALSSRRVTFVHNNRLVSALTYDGGHDISRPDLALTT